MKAYYNEFDPYAAQWLRNLISAGLIAPGDVDDRSITDVRPDDLAGYTQCHFFAGIGGWSYAARLAGWPDDAPIWTGSCPCQPFSQAGARHGFADKRHLWPEFRRLICERHPAVIFGEQVAGATDWLRVVRGDLEGMGYAVGAVPIEASSAGADHKRDRFWFVADADFTGSLPGPHPGVYCEQESTRPWYVEPIRHSPARHGDLANANSQRQQGRQKQHQWPHKSEQPASCRDDALRCDLAWAIGSDGKARRVKPGIRLLAHGIPGRVGLLRGFGNAIDPRPAAQVIGAYMDARAAA